MFLRHTDVGKQVDSDKDKDEVCSQYRVSVLFRALRYYLNLRKTFLHDEGMRTWAVQMRGKRAYYYSANTPPPPTPFPARSYTPNALTVMHKGRQECQR